jgi:hypothetical protein
VLPRALWSGGSGFAAQGSGRALAPVHLLAPSLCPEEAGLGLCFLLRSSPGWPWGPAYYVEIQPVGSRGELAIAPPPQWIQWDVEQGSGAWAGPGAHRRQRQATRVSAGRGDWP